MIKLEISCLQALIPRTSRLLRNRRITSCVFLFLSRIKCVIEVRSVVERFYVSFIATIVPRSGEAVPLSIVRQFTFVIIISLCPGWVLE